MGHARALRGAIGSCEERQRPPFNSSAGAILARPPGPQVLPCSVLSSQPLAPQSFYPSCWGPPGTLEPQLPGPSVHAPSLHPKLASGLRGSLQIFSTALISRRTSALQGSDHTPARLRHSATPRPQPPLCNANCLQSPCPLLLGSLHHRQSLQSSCVHITHTHRHNTPAHPLSKHTKPTRAPQMHSSDPHRCPTHVTHYTHKISSGTYAPTNTQICAQTQHTLH